MVTDEIEETIYEVFLSFYGDDTRLGFTDFLYTYLVDADVNTFRDNENLHVGEEIGPELLKAISESKISIPIFSTNYAFSKWCLLELSQMVHCEGQKIIPIFYDVNPSDVQNQKGSYMDAFCQHENNFDAKTVQGWKEALTKVGSLKGLELKKETNGYEGKLVKKVAEVVKLELNKNYMSVPETLIGMDYHKRKMEEFLNADSDCVQILGIYGMGGIGKTTIAKVFNNLLYKQFEFCCFVENVDDKDKQQSNGFVDLKRQYFKKKALIILDDVAKIDRLDKLVGNCNGFGLGSSIIITTRNKGVIDYFISACKKKDLPGVYWTYEPPFMNPDDSLKLFSKHAFGADLPPEDYVVLSKKIIGTAAGLPLALVTIGLLLHGKDRDLWEETLKKHKKIPHEDVMKKLITSFDALSVEEKHIFLDIACLFIGEDKRKPFYMWEHCEYYPRTSMEALVHRSLVKVRDDNRLWMHAQFRDLGRQIVRKENEQLGERSRLWHHEEALDVFERCLGTKKVVALCLDLTWEKQEFPPNQLVGGEFKKLTNLKYLRVGYADFAGDFKRILSDLRWLQCWGCSGDFMPSNFYLKNLVILDLSYIRFTEEGWSQIVKMAKSLKVLNLYSCTGLRGPDFSVFITLLHLDICGSELVGSLPTFPNETTVCRQPSLENCNNRPRCS